MSARAEVGPVNVDQLNLDRSYDWVEVWLPSVYADGEFGKKATTSVIVYGHGVIDVVDEDGQTYELTLKQFKKASNRISAKKSIQSFTDTGA